GPRASIGSSGSVLNEKVIGPPRVGKGPSTCGCRAGAEVYDGAPVDERQMARLLDDVAVGAVPVADAIEALRGLPYEQLFEAKVDHHRELRTGHPEAIYGPGKSTEQIRDIARALAARATGAVLITRATSEQA